MCPNQGLKLCQLSYCRLLMITPQSTYLNWQIQMQTEEKKDKQIFTLKLSTFKILFNYFRRKKQINIINHQENPISSQGLTP